MKEQKVVTRGHQPVFHTIVGKTKREDFAIQILSALVRFQGPTASCETAVKKADELIKELNK